MISRRTIFSLLLALLIVVGLRAWELGHWDNCDRYMAGDHSLPASEYVESGSHLREMDCTVWLPRQPAWVQAICLLELVVTVVFLLGVWGDWSRWRDARRNAAARMS